MIPADAARLFELRFGLAAGDPALGPEVPAGRLIELVRALKEELGYRFLVTCAGVHLPRAGQAPDRVLVAWILRRLEPGAPEARFHVVVPSGESVPSLAGLLAGADWQEREQYDLVGVRFEGHPDLRRLLLPDDWGVHPLRRDQPIDAPHPPWR